MLFTLMQILVLKYDFQILARNIFCLILNFTLREIKWVC